MSSRYKNTARQRVTPNALAAQTEAKFQQALQLHQQGQLAQAKVLYEEVLKSQPRHFDALHLSGVIAFETRNFKTAVELIGKAIKIQPDNAAFYSNRGNALKELKQLDDAVASYDRAIALKPDYAEAYYNRGVALQEMKQLDDAVASYDQAIALKLDFALAYNNRGNALKELKKLDDAVASYDKTIALTPDFAEAYSNRGNTLRELRQLEDAVASYDRAIALKPDFAEAYCNRGVALKELTQLDDAILSYDRSIALKPDFAEAYYNRGDALRELKQFDDALASYEKALALKSDGLFLLGIRLNIKMHICDWSAFDLHVSQLAEKIERHENASTPFPFLAIKDSPSLQQEVAKIFVEKKYPGNHLLPKIPEHFQHEKIRIGYFSADFYSHPVSFLTVELFELHHKDTFELFAFSFGPQKKDKMRERIEVAFDHFLDVQNLSDMDIAKLSRNLEIDIAIDLGGFTEKCRTGIFAFRAAPVQVNYIGYLGTMGADYIDYLIADPMIVPEKSRKYYCEKIAYLPSYQVNDTKRRIADKLFTREELGLPEKGFVFCCFNNNYKITPGTFDGWMRILLQVEGSVLFLYTDNEAAAVNLKNEAKSRGIDKERLIFGKRLSLPEHLARYRVADLFLDTLPYNAGATASDALWAGLPVLTCMGKSFASRVAASLLNAIHLPELITSTQEEYETLAIELATNPEKLKLIRKKLEQNRLTTPLFDTQLFTQHLEEAYRLMYDRYRKGLPPEHITLPTKTIPTRKAAPNALAAQTEGKFQQALQLHQQGQLAQAQILYEKILKSQPEHFDALHLSGVIAYQTKNPEKAITLIKKAIEICPNNAAFYNNQGITLQELKQFEDAVASYDQAIALKPDYAEAYNNRGNALQELRQFDNAVESYDQAIARNPNYAKAYNNRGDALQKLKQLDDAVTNYNRAIALKPDYAKAYCNCGDALQELKKLDDAVANYNRAIALKPDYALAFYNRGNALLELKQLDDAVASYGQAIALKPDYAKAYGNRGYALQELKKIDDAVASYDRAIALKPDYAEAYFNRGYALQELKQLDDAVANYDRAIVLKPDYAEAYYNQGIVLQQLKQYEKAHASYKKALELSPEGLFLLGMYLSIKMKICDWSAFDLHLSQLAEKIEHHENASTPFPFLAIKDSPSLQQEVAKIFVEKKYPATHALPEIPKRERHDKIRIGYYSADFRNHPMMYLLAELFEKHDRGVFEITAFALGPESQDAMRKRAEAAFDRFINVENLSDIDIVNLSRNFEIDIAIDLAGFTKSSRTGIFALGAAPIQVNYLGYPGTMGADYIDYLIADRTLIPESSRQYYTEKIVYLPDCYQVNDAQRRIADKVFTRKELGLPETGFVFCCFNNNYKITPATFDGWMRILKQAEGSVLWLFEDNISAANNLRLEAIERGIEAERLIFAQRMPLSEHLARHRLADLFLDTLPYNAHTTASDALWAGLPVLTCMGESFASRVAASLLNAIHLPELITATQEEYEALAVELAANPEKLRLIRKKLEQNRLTTPLFDTQLFTQHIEDAYRIMYNRYQEGLPPEHIVLLSKAIPMQKVTPNALEEQTQTKFEQALQLHQQGQLAQAEALYEEILKSVPEHFDALHLSGVIATQTKNVQKGIELIGKAIEIDPNNAASYNNQGIALKALRKFDNAVASYDRAIALRPDYEEAFYNRGIALEELKRPDDAVASYERAIALKHDHAEAYCGRGNALRKMQQYEKALSSYNKALALKPDGLFWLGTRLHIKMRICDWNAYELHLSQLIKKIELHEKVSSPFPILAIADTLSLQKKVARIYVQEKYSATHGFPTIPMRARHDKIRIGYYSADFHDHATAYLMAELFETHNRSKFELFAFSFGPEKADGMRVRVAAAFDHFLDVRTQLDKDVTLLSRELEIDIAVDLKGFTQDSRTNIFALRAAPIQVNYLGYPGTMSAEYIDYLIADRTLIPESSRQYYTEKIVYLPDCYQVNDAQRRIADKVFTRKELGLPETGFVFCCFNNNYKITPATFDGWMRILKQAEGSVLWLFEDNISAANNLRLEAIERGIEAERLIFAQRMPLSEHLARHRLADLFLDTLPYNAHTTASDALWAGLPVLTCMGESFASRVAASLLNAIHLPELVTSSQEEYEALAIELATNPEKLELIRQKLEQNRLTTPLFDTQLFTQNLEEAYRLMYERYKDGLPPDHLFIDHHS